MDRKRAQEIAKMLGEIVMKDNNLKPNDIIQGMGDGTCTCQEYMDAVNEDRIIKGSKCEQYPQGLHPVQNVLDKEAEMNKIGRSWEDCFPQYGRVCWGGSGGEYITRL